MEIGYIKPRSITDEMQESYLDYAMSVIIARALPDVRDGLKPVHRRVLYAMWDIGLKAASKYRKSATVVGEVLGKYHPHGDIPVYDSMVRMAQDFAMRYPLVDGQGNWGSIDGDSAAAMRYCITGDSLVVTNRCLEKIGKIVTKEESSLKVLSFGKKVNPVSKWFDSGIHPTIKIKTFRGYSLKGSFNHPILTLQPDLIGKPVFKWKLLSKLKKGDYAVIDRDSKTLWLSEDPDLTRFYPETKNRRLIVHKLPSKMTPELAFLLGAIIAEGYISINKKQKYGKIGFCNVDKDFIKEFRTKFKKVFPDCPISEQKRTPLSYGKEKFVAFEICSLYLVEFLRNLGIGMVASREKQVPQIMFHTTKESMAAFLRGLVEGDGSIYICNKPGKKNTKEKSVEITFISTSHKLLQELQIILLRFGIDSFLRFEKARGTWRLFIHGHDNLNIFRKHIGFVSKEKRQKLDKACKFNPDYRIMSKSDFIPFIADYLRRKYQTKKIKWVFKDWLARHNLDRYPKLKNYNSILKKILDKEDLKLINFFINQHYLFDKVVTIQSNGKERVYSLRVDSKCHSFISNGFVSHNTECRLSKISEELLFDLEKETVNFVDNYDRTQKEPQVLPAKLPNLLLNGTMGIAVGMATNIPPHNLGEVTDAICHLIDHPKAGVEDLCKFIKGPDFPTGGLIFDKKEILHAYATGRGAIVMRGLAEIQETKKGQFSIIINEVPYQINKADLVTRIAELVKNKKLEGIRDIRDESSKEGIRINIELRKEAYPKKILNRLYALTPLQEKYHVTLLTLVDGIQPRVLTLKEILEYYIKHRQTVVERRTRFDLKVAKERAHILEGLKIALDHLDSVIKLIKKSKTREEAHQNLKKRFKLSDLQAKAILDMRLHQLARLERKKIEDELKEKKRLIIELESILASPRKILKIIKNELLNLKKKYGDERKTKVIASPIGEFKPEELIPEENVAITLTRGGYIKSLAESIYKAQARGGKGVRGMEIKEEDVVEHFFITSSHADILFFTNAGKVFQLKAYEIPKSTRTARGQSIVNFLSLHPEEKITAIIPLGPKEKRAIKFLAMVTKHGLMKKVKIEDFVKVRRSGLVALKLKKGDALEWVNSTSGKDEIIIITAKGQAIRFKETDIRAMGRAAAGVRGIRLKGDDEVVGMAVIGKEIDTKLNLLIMTENGYGKQTNLKYYRRQKRGGSGIKTAKVTKKTGNIVAAKVITPDIEEIIVISKKGQVIRTALKNIRLAGRATQGVRIMKLASGDKVASVAYI